ncbi:hypothetical protein ACM66B_001599 [Microbotryomycetes sp. NB124-2]
MSTSQASAVPDNSGAEASNGPPGDAAQAPTVETATTTAEEGPVETTELDLDVNETRQAVNDVNSASLAEGPVAEAASASAAPTRAIADLPADIEHILSLGVTDIDPAELDRANQTDRRPSELEQVVQQLKHNAGLGTGASAQTQTQLDKIEQELEQRGVTRRTAVAEEGEAEEHGGGDANMSEGSSTDDDTSDDSSDSSDNDSSDDDEPGDTKPQAVNSGRTAGQRQRAAASDDDDDDEADGATGAGPRTEHEVEVPDVALPTIDKVPAEHALAPLGTVQSVIENVLVVKAGAEGSYRVLDEGTICCWSDRTVIGSIFETFGSIKEPFYSLRFPASALPDPAVFTRGRPVHYAPTLASFVFTRELRNLKGTDASNVYDEEVGAAEIEFSDDEAEQEYRRTLKAERRQARHQNSATSASASHRQAANGAGRPPQPSGVASLPARPATSYADLDSSVPDDIYKPQSMRGFDIGSKPPSGREGRRMFERATGSTGVGAEFEFSDGSDDDDSASEAVQAPLGAGVGRGGRGSARGRGGQRGRGQARGRGGGGGGGGDRSSPGGRQIAGLPPRPNTLPQRPMTSVPGGSMPPPPSFEHQQPQSQSAYEYDPRNAGNMQMTVGYSQPTYAQNMYGGFPQHQLQQQQMQYPTFGFPPTMAQGFGVYGGMTGASSTYRAHQSAATIDAAASGHFNPRFFAGNAGDGAATSPTGHWQTNGQYHPPPQ